jgi:hypothetical protein
LERKAVISLQQQRERQDKAQQDLRHLTYLLVRGFQALNWYDESSQTRPSCHQVIKIKTSGGWDVIEIFTHPGPVFKF